MTVQPYHNHAERVESLAGIAVTGTCLQLRFKPGTEAHERGKFFEQRALEELTKLCAPPASTQKLSAPRRRTTSFADQASYPPRGMRVDRAANYTGMSRTTFLELVREGVMPQPMRIGGMTIWDRQALDAALDHLSEQAEREKEGSQRMNTVDAILGLKK